MTNESQNQPRSQTERHKAEGIAQVGIYGVNPTFRPEAEPVGDSGLYGYPECNEQGFVIRDYAGREDYFPIEGVNIYFNRKGKDEPYHPDEEKLRNVQRDKLAEIRESQILPKGFLERILEFQGFAELGNEREFVMRTSDLGFVKYEYLPAFFLFSVLRKFKEHQKQEAQDESS